MIRLISSESMGRAHHGWLESYFHFSFAEYYNPKNIQFGVLRVLNDDMVQPGTGFGAHPHDNMEIISYCIDGELTHGDSMGNEKTISRGQVQYMSAGTGVVHSEYNLGTQNLRFLQIWIFPDAQGYLPNYGDYRFEFEPRIDKWMPLATWTQNDNNNAPIKINSDINAYASFISKGKALDFEIQADRQAYMVLIEGEAQVGDLYMKARDALEIIGESIKVEAVSDAHILIIEMAKPVSPLN